jgi:hypothetical protein
MRAFLVSAAIALLLWLVVGYVASRCSDEAVRTRFVEHTDIIPGPNGTQSPLNFENLKHWIEANPHSARFYLRPVLLPLDFLFLAVFGATLAFGSVLAARYVSWVAALPPWAWWILPSIYMVADFLEDILLVGFFRNPAWLTEGSYWALSNLTSLKLISVKAAMAQLGILGVIAIVRRFIRTA